MLPYAVTHDVRARYRSRVLQLLLVHDLPRLYQFIRTCERTVCIQRIADDLWRHAFAFLTLCERFCMVRRTCRHFNKAMDKPVPTRELRDPYSLTQHFSFFTPEKQKRILREIRLSEYDEHWIKCGAGPPEVATWSEDLPATFNGALREVVVSNLRDLPTIPIESHQSSRDSRTHHC